MCEIGGTVCPGFKIGWVSSVVIRLFYGHTLFGETTIPDLPVVPDRGNNHLCLTGHDKGDDCFREDGTHVMEMEIQNMVAFKSLFDDIMPRKDADQAMDYTKRTTASLSVSPNGHQLTMSIDVARMPRMKCSVKSLKISGEGINIAIMITNPSPVRLGHFRRCTFVLLKGQEAVGRLAAHYSIRGGKRVYRFVGKIDDGVSGLVVLKGDVHDEGDGTWKRHVPGIFEVEIDLDKAPYGDFGDIRDGDDEEDEDGGESEGE